MKYCILTPTFSGHFKYLKNYLTSFSNLVSDKEECEIVFIISEDENDELLRITEMYPQLNIRIEFFDDILKYYNITLAPDELLQKYEKFSFQALKKFYGMLYLKEYQHFLVLDTESIWLNPTSMKEMFEGFFSHPQILFSDNNKRYLISKSNAAVTENINYILNSDGHYWFVEQYLRFWDSQILNDICNEYGTPFEIVQKIYLFEKNRKEKLGLFESVLYDQYIFEHNDKYHYKLLDLDEECAKYLSPEVLHQYRTDMAKTWKGSCGLLESCSILLNKENYSGFANLFKNNNLNVIRIETEPQNYIYQKKFLDIVKPEILTCSQDNLFGVDKTFMNAFRIYVLNTPTYKYFYSGLKGVAKPFLPIVKWLKEVFKTLFWLTGLIINFIRSFTIWFSHEN